MTEFIGSIGGNTYQSNGSGFIVRQKPKIKLSRTANQVTQINNFVTLSQLYRNLSNANKVLWNSFAVANPFTDLWGVTKTISGINYYCMVNHYSNLVGSGTFDSPPVYVTPVIGNGILLTIDAVNLNISAAAGFGLVSQKCLIFATSPFNNIAVNPRKLVRLISVALLGTDVSYNAQDDWESVFYLDYLKQLFDRGNAIRCYSTLIDTTCPIPSAFVGNT